MDKAKLISQTTSRSKQHQRIIVFDIIKLFAIFLVIWGHCILHLQNHQYNVWGNPLYRWIASFHMPLFMMISGFFSSKTLGIREFAQKKFHQLILPSLTFGVLFVLSWHFVCGGGVLKPYILCYWFLKSAFICSLLYFMAEKFQNRIVGYIITIGISLWCFLYFVNLMYIPFLVGVGLYQHKNRFIRNSLPILLFTGTGFLSMFFYWDYTMASMPLLRLYRYLNPVVWPQLGYHSYCYAYKVVMGILGSVFIITTFIQLAKYLPSNRIGRLFGKWGTMTLGIYLWQAIILEHFMMRTIDLSKLDWNIFNYCVTPLLSVGVMVICILLTKPLRYNRWTTYLFLGGSKT